MRTELANHVGEFVSGIGWFKESKKLRDMDSVRILISQPTLKRPDRNVLWKDLKTISTEHHLNMFHDLGTWEKFAERISLYERNFFGQ